MLSQVAALIHRGPFPRRLPSPDLTPPLSPPPRGGNPPVLGWTAAGAFPHDFCDTADDITSVLTLDGSGVTATTRFAAYLFPPVGLGGAGLG